MDSNSRSIAKAVSYRVLGSLATAGIVYFFSRSLSASAGAGLADSIIKIGLYFLHERIWNHIAFGRPKAPDYQI